MPKPTRRVELTPTRRTELAERYAHLDLTPKRGEKRRKPLQTVSAASLPRRRTHWLWDHRIPEGALTIVAGLEDRGKSLVVTRVVEQLGHGTLPGDWAGEPAKALIVCREDGHDETSRRLEAAGADLALVEYIVEPSDVDERGRYVRRRQGRHELEPLPDFHALRHTAAMGMRRRRGGPRPVAPQDEQRDPRRLSRALR